MTMLGTALRPGATKVMLLGAGELGKEVAIECQRLGIEVIAVDRYDNAPAMHIAHRRYVINMLDGAELESVIRKEKPDYVVPEIEAIATDTLYRLEQEGLNVVPCANAVKLTMNREGIRRLAAEELGLLTSEYRFVDDEAAFVRAAGEIGFPCIIKPVMSSSGKGQSVILSEAGLSAAWRASQDAGRAGKGRVIVERMIPFDYEITLLTVRAVDGVHFCAPVGHRQENGDYRESWQPQAMSDATLLRAQQVAETIVNGLGGFGLFGVELFVRGDDIIFNEVSPRPHDTGLVTLVSQNISEFALHVRAFLGLPAGDIIQYAPAASAVILPSLTSDNVCYSGLENALHGTVQLRLFAKPVIDGSRRMGVALATASCTEEAVSVAQQAAAAVVVTG
ncbi:formate-dependent phosphoribosylglycinamide formyltransferase [Morganella psychrotolerans]|uniref:Formate-dependent phosphoribosylglycinamide formyltransferase n=1 Tax=Morganella psychrotolerans TaxID=368603 RepID=A0A1B8HAX6_9GAMM|nr:formate-dependent phosphoribosylglycinamide formyltransferase [Morganella psychrotolerans]OBU06226.1 phosphoribosylglycinamide formyltransferase 2 [Morganella psychrotolerans]